MLTTQMNESRSAANSSLQMRTMLLEQMAEALEDEAAGLYRRAAAFEEDEFLLNKEIDDRQTEINRLQLKLDGLRSERDRLMERIENITEEAQGLRDESLNRYVSESVASPDHDIDAGAVYFRRATLTEPAAGSVQ
jgi:chromosome segregation ATPase